jgi:hypothetical protein
MIPKTKYLFIDESGNFDFSKKGTRYFILTAILAEDTYGLQHDLLELKLKLADQFEHYLEYFHATEDKQFVRDKVFKIISERLPNIEIYSVCTTKCSAGYRNISMSVLEAALLISWLFILTRYPLPKKENP